MPHWIRNASAAMGLAGLLALGIGSWQGGGVSPAWAQGEVELEIEDVIESLDRDFSFGGKEEVKREILKDTNSAKREDVQTQQNQALQQQQQGLGGVPNVPVLIQVEERKGGGSVDVLIFSIPNGPSVQPPNDGLDFLNTNLPSGSNQNLNVQCVFSEKGGVPNMFCEFEAIILSGNGKFQQTGTPNLGTKVLPIDVPLGATLSFPFTVDPVSSGGGL